MIIRGKGRGSAGQLSSYLGDYLKKNPKNEKATVLEVRGSAFLDLDRSFRSWEAESIGSRCKKPLWHASIRGPADEILTRTQQIAAADILEKHLGFQGQPRAIVEHRLHDGSTHIHVVWSRIRREDETVTLKSGEIKTYRAGTAKRDDFTDKKNVAAAREIEDTFGLRHVDSPDFKNDDKSKSRRQRREDSDKAASQKDYERAKRSGLDPKERKQTIDRLWHETGTGHEFRQALEDNGYILAHGTKRSYVVVDRAGDPHSVARQIKGVYAADVKERFKDLDPASIPQVNHVKQQLRQAWKEREQEKADATVDMHEPDQAHPDKSAQLKHPVKPPRYGEQEEEFPLDPANILAGVTRGRSTFTKSDLLHEIGKRIETYTGFPDQRKKLELAREVSQLEDYVGLGPDRYGKQRYTSRDMLETELDMRDSSDALAVRSEHGVWHKLRDAAPSAQRLGEEQRAAYEHVTGAASFAAVIGYAGTGKSTMLGAAREAWEAAGYRVKGYALSGMAAQSLQEGAKIESRTLASLFYATDKLPEQEEKLREMDRKVRPMTGSNFAARKLAFDLRTRRDAFAERIEQTRMSHRDIIVLDEAAMVGSKQIARLLEMAEKARAKVVLVGDAEQLQAIDAGGGAFRALTDRHGAVKISGIRRQKEDWAREATKVFGDGFTGEALETYNEKGHIHELGTRTDARTKMIEAWTASRQLHVNDSHLMLAFTRADVASLNEQGRKAYEAEGRLGVSEPVRTADGVKDFARGDRLYFLQNDARLKVKNGSLGTIENIETVFPGESHRITVRLDNAEGKTVTFDTGDYDKFSHGFAATVHRSQGVTTNRSYVLASQFMDRHATYVAMSRHTDQADMFYGKTEFSDFDKLSWTLSRDRRKDTTLDYLDRMEHRPSRHAPEAEPATEATTSRKPPAQETMAAPLRQIIGQLKVTIGERPDNKNAPSEDAPGTRPPAPDKTPEQRTGERVLSMLKDRPEPVQPANTDRSRERRIADRIAAMQQKKLDDILNARKRVEKDIAL